MASAQTTVDFGGIRRPPGRLDDGSALDAYPQPLTQRLAAHLLRRAGFGGSPDDVRRYTGMSVRAAVDSFIHFPSTAGLPGPDNAYSPIGLLSQYGPRGLRAMTDEQRKELNRQIRANEFGSLRDVQLWWLNRMLVTPAPLQEKMALYFHGHFTSTALQKGVSPAMIYNQNQLFRDSALGNLRELTRSVSKDPAMLVFLDNDANLPAHPNENYARELMELFTLGVNQYTEEDIRNSARAWTGWRYSRFTEQAAFDPRFHDFGVKTFLGRTGNFDGDDIVNIIFEQPQCARFFATSLLSAFVYNDPEPELVDGVAGLLRRHNFELMPVMATILRSNVFYSDRAYRALVKSPVEFVVGTYKTLGLPQMDATVLPVLRQMGQELFYPPNVAGWPGGENWLTSDTMIARQNFLKRTVNSQTIAQSSWLRGMPLQAHTVANTLVSSILQGDAAPASVFKLDGYLAGAGSSALAALSPENYDERVSGATYLAMAMPAYQLS
ncbi:MAG: DUF1800 domain-containing protein [Candidatus Eremiobacteraeota bacterium]|nr:DUF1800 domain-containing protein [Candidatus Eremiobacteraeota bacterium]